MELVYVLNVVVLYLDLLLEVPQRESSYNIYVCLVFRLSLPNPYSLLFLLVSQRPFPG